jgi:hypothetical protein
LANRPELFLCRPLYQMSFTIVSVYNRVNTDGFCGVTVI